MKKLKHKNLYKKGVLNSHIKTQTHKHKHTHTHTHTHTIELNTNDT